MRRKNKDAAAQVAHWNRLHPEGESVVYSPRIGCPAHERVRTTTCSSAFLLGGHTAVVMLDGVRGAVGLDFVEAVIDERPSG